MIYLSAHESNHGVPLPFRKIDPKAHELHLIDRNHVIAQDWRTPAERLNANDIVPTFFHHKLLA